MPDALDEPSPDRRYLVTLYYTVGALNPQHAIQRVLNGRGDTPDAALVDSSAEEVDEVTVTLAMPDGASVTWHKQLAFTNEESELKDKLEELLGRPTRSSS